MAISCDTRPSDYEYVLLSKQVYSSGKSTPKLGSHFTTHTRTWTVVFVKDSPSGYFGAVYRDDASKQFVVASRGASNIADLYEGVQGVLLNKCSPQKEDAFSLVDAVVQNINDERHGYRLSFTGHSLGGFISELCAYYAYHSLNFSPVNAVSFESPGARQSLELLAQKIGRYESIEEDFQSLDVICYLCYPNLVNSSNDHIGSVYGINVEAKGGILASVPGMRMLGNHKLDEIVNFFQNVCVQKDRNCKRYFMLSWPKGYNQLDVFLKYAELNKEGIYTLDHDDDDETEDATGPSATTTTTDVMISPETASMELLPRSIHKLALDDHKRNSPASETPSNNIKPHGKSSNRFSEWLKEQKCQKVSKYFKKVKVLNSLSSFQSIPMRHFSVEMQIFLEHFYEKLHLVYGDFNESEQKEKQDQLISIWKGFLVPEDIRDLLLSYSIHTNSAGLEELLCSSKVKDVHEFRTEVSAYLEASGFSVDDLIFDSLLLPPFPGRSDENETNETDAETTNESPDFSVSNETVVQ